MYCGEVSIPIEARRLVLHLRCSQKSLKCCMSKRWIRISCFKIALLNMDSLSNGSWFILPSPTLLIG